MVKPWFEFALLWVRVLVHSLLCIGVQSGSKDNCPHLSFIFPLLTFKDYNVLFGNATKTIAKSCTTAELNYKKP
jgi:hypothetical protein